MKDIRVGVVGLGMRGRSMFSLAVDTFDCAIPAAACDIKPTNWYEQQWRADAAFAEKYPDTPFYTDYDEMLEKADLDLVIVETGADIHAEFCCKALEKNINVMTDIPVVANLAEAERLWKTAQRSKAMISVGANPNEQRFVVMLKEAVANGKLGKPYCMEAEYIHWSKPGSAERIHYNENGDWRKLLIPIHYCTHSLGPLLTVLDEELRYVSCFGTGKHSEESTKDDMMCANFRTETGVVVRLMRNGRCRAQIGHHNYRVFGTEGYMERIERFEKPVIRYNFTCENDNELQEVDGKFMPPEFENEPRAKGHGGMDYALFAHLFDALQNDKPAPISLKEGLAMTIPGIYAAESAKRNGAVLKMHYPWDEDWTTEIE